MSTSALGMSLPVNEKFVWFSGCRPGQGMPVCVHTTAISIALLSTLFGPLLRALPRDPLPFSLLLTGLLCAMLCSTFHAAKGYVVQQHYLTITQAAKLYGVARTTPYRAIQRGTMSSTVRGDGTHVIAFSELLRVWGEPPNMPPEMQQNAAASGDAVQQSAAPEIWAAMLAELKSLRIAVERLEEQQKLLAAPAEEAAQAMAADKPADVPAPHPFAAEMAALRAKREG